MDIELIWNRKNICVILLVIIFFILTLTGCDTVVYPMEETSKWVCENPNIVLDYQWYGSGDYVFYETLEWNGKTMEIYLSMGASSYSVYDKATLNQTHTGYFYDDRLFCGTWECNGETLVLTIEEDFLFNGEYQELVFRRVE